MNKETLNKTLQTLLKMDEAKLHSTLYQILGQYPFKSIDKTPDYIIAEGTLPVGLVAHLDVVHAEEFFYDEQDSTLVKMTNAGFDDRCGVAAILALLEMHKDNPPTIIFTTGEETGGIGADKVSKRVLYPYLNYLIELDRAGYSDAVFYNCANPHFENFILSSGFWKKEKGTFTDISIICPRWRVAGVNLSIGYYHEHTPYEFADLEQMVEIIQRVSDLISQPTKQFTYTPDKVCLRCYKETPNWDSVEVEGDNYCTDCFHLLVKADMITYDDKGVPKYTYYGRSGFNG